MLPALAALLAIGQGARADGPGKSLYAFELEIGARSFSNIVDLYDMREWVRQVPWASLDQNRLNGVVLSDYLLNPAALRALPESLRAELTRGLDLGIHIEAPKPKALVRLEAPQLKPEGTGSPTGLLGPDGKPVGTRSGSLVNGTYFEAPSNAPGYEKTATGIYRPKELAVSEQSDWLKLHRRWNALPLEAKLSVVDPELLTSDKKAELVMAGHLGNYKSSLSKKLIPKPEAPEWTRVMEPTFDAVGVVEFHPYEPFEDLASFEKTYREIARATRLEAELDRPAFRVRQDYSLHWHLSIENTDLKALAAEYKKLVTLRVMALAAEPDLDPILGNKANSYSSTLRVRGPVRLVSENRLEGREHFSDPVSEMREFEELARLPSEEGIRRVHAQMAKLARKRPELASAIARRIPQHALEFAIPMRSPSLVREAQETVLHRLLQKPRMALDPFRGIADAAFLERIAGDPDPAVSAQVSTLFDGQKLPPDSPLIERMLNHPNPRARQDFVSRLKLLHPDSYTHPKALEMLLKAAESDPEIGAWCFDLLARNERLQSHFRRLLRLRPGVESAFHAAKLVDLKNPGSVRQVQAWLAEEPDPETRSYWLRSQLSDIFHRQPGQFARTFPEELDRVILLEDPTENPVIRGILEKLDRGRALQGWERAYLARAHSNRLMEWVASSLPARRHAFITALERSSEAGSSWVYPLLNLGTGDRAFDSLLTEALARQTLRKHVLETLVRDRAVHYFNDFPWDLDHPEDLGALRRLAPLGEAREFLEGMIEKAPERFARALPELADRFDFAPFPRCEYLPGPSGTPGRWRLSGPHAHLFERIGEGVSMAEVDRALLADLIRRPLDPRSKRQVSSFAFLLSSKGAFRDLALRRLGESKREDNAREFIRLLMQTPRLSISAEFRGILPQPHCVNAALSAILPKPRH